MEIQEVTEKALTITQQANAVTVTNEAQKKAAGELFLNVKSMMKAVDESFDPIITKAHQAHKEAVAQKKKHYEPLDAAAKYVKKIIGDYDTKLENERKAEERRLADIARKEAEEKAIQEAIESERQAKLNGATQEEAAAVAERVIEQPVYVPPVVVPKAKEKISGMVFRETTKFRIKDESLIPRQFLIPDMVKIGGVVRSLGIQANIPGVEIWMEKV